MKALFLTFFQLSNDGISKKILSQRDGLIRSGFDTDLSFEKKDGGRTYFSIGDKTIYSWKNKSLCRIMARPALYNRIIKHLKSGTTDFIYIRYTHFATPSAVRFFKKINRLKIKTALEIPTYPYDGEYGSNSGKSRLMIQLERWCRKRMARFTDKIVTFSDDEIIWNRPTIRISNAVDFNEIQIKKTTSHPGTISLIAVASIEKWHGFDRIIEGLREYYQAPQPVEVILNIVGGSDQNTTLRELKRLIETYHLEKYVVFHGFKTGNELDALFDQSDVAIGSLGRHRNGIFSMKPLKNREYAARGIPFIDSVTDADFENQPYLLKIPADESPVNIQTVVRFFENGIFNPAEIRQSVTGFLSWEVQMKIVKDEMFPESLQ